MSYLCRLEKTLNQSKNKLIPTNPTKLSGFNPSIDWHNVNFDDKYAVSIQNQPITSMVSFTLSIVQVVVRMRYTASYCVIG